MPTPEERLTLLEERDADRESRVVAAEAQAAAAEGKADAAAAELASRFKGWRPRARVPLPLSIQELATLRFIAKELARWVR